MTENILTAAVLALWMVALIVSAFASAPWWWPLVAFLAGVALVVVLIRRNTHRTL